MDELAEIYIKEIIRLHGVPFSIISDRDIRFTSTFWETLYSVIGTKLNFNRAFHPETDDQSERTIQTLKDMLRESPIEFQESWSKFLPLVEYAYNNSYHWHGTIRSSMW